MTSATQAPNAPARTLPNRPNMVSVGTMVWLTSELMFFAGLFAMFFTLRSTQPEMWAEYSSRLDITLATIITVILVASSVTAQFGVFAAERHQPRRTGSLMNIKNWGMVEWYILSFLMGAIFIAGQTFEFAELVSHGVAVQTNAFGSAFYITTGFHGLHVIGGLIAFLYVIARAYFSVKFTHKEASAAVVISYYWHFVDVVWIALFGVVYLLPLFV
ncbi:MULTISPECIES: cytochrome c oxidase subunit 3 [Nesterenkonia]|uniref:cytochrome-c oxidase n=1 Tax=Nesterenkonia xinjiangensis TaxID=225327 RepID=A0A7Z0GNW1_9MICC|nr:cytochrome c oxidase subunit 3 [Nesterenkonia sp. HG001]MDZ5077942.1 cytochrome c oxidase subunit 3 [Nesterenkonia sp. HG001]NYJ79454.1 cytochrome c oxidase subunit 3 [Nesterenkonia xinjiangensis]